MRCATRSGAERLAGFALLTGLLLFQTAYSETSHEADLERMRGEIAQLKARLTDVKRQTRSAQQQLDAIDLELGIHSRELGMAIEIQQELQSERANIEGEVSTLIPRLAQQRRFLALRLSALYRTGGLTYLRMLMALDAQRNPVEGIAMLSFLVSRDARAVSNYESGKVQLARRRSDLADREKRIAEMRHAVEERRNAVSASHEEKARLVTALRKEESGSARELAELVEKATRLEHLIALLAGQHGQVEGSVDVRSLQGALPWPVAGNVVERFGRQRNVRFNTFTTNNGVKIATEPGAAVRAVFQGTVLFSQWFKGYGNLIILDHGHHVFSLYGNLKAPAVAVGDRIAAGQTIAGAGESEEPSPAHLYFEIRHDNRPEDPQKWLR